MCFDEIEARNSSFSNPPASCLSVRRVKRANDGFWGLAGVVIDPSSAVVPDAVVEILEGRRQALRVGEVANLFSVTPQHIYRMAARGTLPSLRIAGAIRFDPQELAKWLKAKENQMIRPETHRRQSVAA